MPNQVPRSGHDHDHDHGHEHDHDHDYEQSVAGRAAGDGIVNGGSAEHSHLARVLYLDCFAGAAGDMLTGALLDLGVPWKVVAEALAGVALRGYTARPQKVNVSGFAATQLDVKVTEPQPQRHYAEIQKLLAESSLPERLKQLAQATFLRLARAEAQVHGVAIEQVHFHEVGAVDSIVDTVAASACIVHLDAKVWSSPLPLNVGSVHSQHGVIPLPAPAVLALLQGLPTASSALSLELVTPTGAALLAENVSQWCGFPGGTLHGVGVGAGTRRLADRPNVLRAMLLSVSPVTEATSLSHDVIETNLDDATGEALGYAVERLLAMGALDVWVQPITMKKNRPGWTLSVLVRKQQSALLSEWVLNETPAIGLRIYGVQRLELPRREVQVQTAFGEIPLKVSGGEGRLHVKPEFEACRRAAEQQGVPLAEVVQAALAAYFST